MNLSDFKGSIFRNSSALLDRVEKRRHPLTPSEEHELALDTLALELARRSELHTDVLDRLGRSHQDERLFKSFGEQLQAIARAARGLGRDRRLDEVQQRAALGLNESIPSQGGFLLEEDISRDVWLRIYNTDSAILSRVTRLPFGSNTNKFTLPALDETSRVDGSRWGGLRAYWADEAVSVTSSRPKFRQMNLTANKLMGTCFVTDELLADSTLLGGFMAKIAGMELSFKLALAVIRGTGAGQPLGILNSPGTIIVDKEAGQAAGSLNKTNLLKMFERMYAAARETIVWYVHREVEDELYSLDLGNIFEPAGSLSRYPSLFGAPVIPIEPCSTLGNVGDIILAQPSDYLIVDKPISFVPSIHVQFLTDETAFRFSLRVDGQPLFSSPLTPYLGTVTQSSFVALATRN